MPPFLTLGRHILALSVLAVSPPVALAGGTADLEIVAPGGSMVRLTRSTDGTPAPLVTFYDSSGQRWEVLADLDVRKGSASIFVQARAVSPTGETQAYVMREVYTRLEGSTSLSLGPNKSVVDSPNDLKIKVELLPDDSVPGATAVLTRSLFAEVHTDTIAMSTDMRIDDAHCDSDDVKVVRAGRGFEVRPVHAVHPGDQQQFTCRLDYADGQSVELPVKLVWY